MKKIIIPILLSLITYNSFSQITRKGSIKGYISGFSDCDTLYILGMYKNNNKTKYLVSNIQAGYNYQIPIPERKIKVFEDNLNFWGHAWFEYASYSYITNKKLYKLKKNDEEQILNYLAELESNQKFYEDPFAEDYIAQLIYRIYPDKITIANQKIIAFPKLINDPSIKIQPIANGFLLIGIDFLAKLKNEEELIFELTKGVAHIVLMHGILNINQHDPYQTNSLGLTLSSIQKKATEKIALKFIASKKDTSNKSKYFITEKEYFSKLSGIINYVAWQEYYSNHFDQSMELLDKLIKNDLAIDETYFLKAKILKQLNNNYVSNMQALDLLQKAEESRVHGFMDIYKERGLILLRLGRTSEATEAFQKYKIALEQQQEPDPRKIKWCNNMLYRCGKKLNTAITLH